MSMRFMEEVQESAGFFRGHRHVVIGEELEPLSIEEIISIERGGLEEL